LTRFDDPLYDRVLHGGASITRREATSSRHDPAAGPAGGGDAAIPEVAVYDFARLERAVRGLAQRCRDLAAENRALVQQVEDRDERIAALEDEIRQLQQKRRDVAKRIDDLIDQIDHLDAQVEAGGG
jgi:cell division protein FtsB